MTTEIIIGLTGLFLALVSLGICWLLWIDLRSVWECLADVGDAVDTLDSERPDYEALLRLYREDMARIEAEEAAGK